MTVPQSLLDLLKQTTAAFDAGNIPYAVSGALALMSWGYVRATRDLDVLISVPSLRLPEALEILQALGCAVELRANLESIRRDRFVILDCGGIPVELFVPAIPYHEQVLRRRVVRNVDGQPIWFVTAEDLVVLKMLFNRTKDVADVKGIVATLTSRLDRDYVRTVLRGILPPNDPRLAEIDAIMVTT